MNIPKVIHYCWFGKKKLPPRILNCIESWQKAMPDYEIIEWNETNTILNNEFANKCYSKKRWAFVSDYVRLKVLYEYGGIYLDTDMLVLKNLNSFLINKCFIGSESSNYLSSGVIGAEKNNQFIFQCLEEYNRIKIPSDNRWYKIAIPIIMTEKFRVRYNYNKSFDNIINFFDIKVYPKPFFYPVPNLKREITEMDINNFITEDSYAVHLWEGSWMDVSEFALIKNRQYFRSVPRIFRTIFVYKGASLKYFKKIINSFIHSIN